MVITVVDPVTLPYFERNWLTWRFSANTPIWVILDGVAVSDVWYANNFLPDVVISIADLLSKGSIKLPSKRVAVISPLAIPLPGARLSLPPECGLSAIAIHDIGKSRKIDPVSPEIPVDVDVVTSIEVPLFAILPAVCFVRALQSTGTNLCYLPSLSSRLRAVIWANTKSVEVFDMRRFGWRFSEFTSSALSVPRPN